MKELFSTRRRQAVVRQYDSADCAPAALLSVLRYHGGDAALARVRQLCGTDVHGTQMARLVGAAHSLGLGAKGATGSYEDLRAEQMPCIAHVLLAARTQHYVVIYRMDADRVRIGDPARGIRTVSRSEFEAMWVRRAVILLEPAANLTREIPPPWTAWIMEYLRSDASWINQSLFLGAIYTGLGLVTSLLLRVLIDTAIPSKSLRFTLVTGGVLLAVQLARAAAGYVRQRFLVGVNARVSISMTADFLTHIFRLPIQFFDTRATGDITARINDTVKIQSGVLRAVGAAVLDVLVIAGSLAFIFVFSRPLGVLAIATLPVYAVALGFISREIRDDQRRVMQSFSRVESAYIDSLTGIDVVRGFNVGEVFTRLTRGYFETFQSSLNELGLTQARVVCIAEIVGGAVITATISYATVLVITGRLALGGMLAAYSLLASALPAIGRLIDANIALQGASVAASRLMDLLLLDAESDSGCEKFTLKREISLASVAFTWPRGVQLLTDVSMRLERGRITALWGSSGAGKSTIVKILERKYQPTRGRVYVDDVDAEAFDIASYRRNVAVVPETVKIFNATLLHNITLGRSGANICNPQELVERLGLGAFLNRFPDGLMTLVGEEGRQLSSGERQVVALLRAVASRPALLVIDEGMNAVDVELSTALARAIDEYARENAVLLISHNIGTIARADYVYVLANGRIQREGTFSEMFEGVRNISALPAEHDRHQPSRAAVK